MTNLAAWAEYNVSKASDVRSVLDLQYETSVSLTCRYVLTTLSEFEMVSETTEAQKPMNAKRSSESVTKAMGDEISSDG